MPVEATSSKSNQRTATNPWRSPFPPEVCFEVTCTDDLPQAHLEPTEECILSPRAVQSRREHFALGRLAARRALQRLNEQKRPIPAGARGEPLWPKGVCGSITHTAGIAMAAVSKTPPGLAIGLDIEKSDRAISAGLGQRICSPAEKEWADRTTEPCALLSLFSAKEAIFKAFYPIDQVYLDFLDVHLCWASQSQSFEAKLQRAASPVHPIGYRFQVTRTLQNGFVLCSVYLKPDHRASLDQNRPS